MKHILKGAVAAALVATASTQAMADGMPRRGSIKDAPQVTACGTSAYNWNGAFAGIQLGTAEYRSAVTVEDILNLAGTREDTGLTIGGVVGYNWQRCNTVFGIEAELNWTDVDRAWGINLDGLGLGAGQIFAARSTMDWYGALKMRTGFAFDNLLLYLTGGVAFAKIEHRGANGDLGGLVAPGLIGFANSDTRFGWVIGAGTEYALTNRITWRSEATYTRFRDQDLNLDIPPALLGAPGTVKLNAQDEVWMLRTGLNFKF